MAWSGTIRFGSAFAAYFGPADANELHQHAAYQLVASLSGDAVVAGEHGETFRGSALLIRPLVPHALRASGPLCLLYIDPQSPVALDLADAMGTADICAVPRGTLPFDPNAPPDALVASLEAASGARSNRLDRRLANALDALTHAPGTLRIADAAHACGLSVSHLRALARAQLGVPLSTWLIWRKLERAAKAAASGASLAEAAQAGGFSDQAHFARQMRRMFGVTPSAGMKNLGCA